MESGHSARFGLGWLGEAPKGISRTGSPLSILLVGGLLLVEGVGAGFQLDGILLDVFASPVEVLLRADEAVPVVGLPEGS